MRSLILHANRFSTDVVAESNMPEGIVPETKKSDSEAMEECLVIFFCVEEGDGEKQINDLHGEILKAADEVKTRNLMVAPFVHLSNRIAKPDVAKSLSFFLMGKFSGTEFVVKSSHFGYHKTLVLDVKGHPGSFRYREF